MKSFAFLLMIPIAAPAFAQSTQPISARVEIIGEAPAACVMKAPTVASGVNATFTATSGTTGEIRISEHGYDELSADKISVRDILHGVTEAVLVEDYSDYFKGPCVLVLQRDLSGLAIHVVWGIPKNATTPAVVVTAYRPQADRWSDDFRTRL